MWLTVGQLFGRGTCPCAPTVHTYHIITTINNLHTSNTAGEAGIAFSSVCLSICAKTEKNNEGKLINLLCVMMRHRSDQVLVTSDLGC